MNAAANLLILVLCEAENSAKRIENQLRNAGHAVRTVWTHHAHDLPTLLVENRPKLLLCAAPVPGELFTNVIEQCHEYDSALPVLLLSHRYTASQTLQALDAGARDQVSDEDAPYLRHLQQVCLREIHAYQNLLQLRQTRAQAVAVESRTKNLLTASTDAVASVAEGIFIEANPAFVKLLKYKKAEELVGLPIMDCIVAADQPRLKDYLKHLLKGKITAQTLSCSLLCADQSMLSTDIAFSLDKTSKEPAVQLLIRAPKQQAPAPAAAPADAGAGRIPFMKRLKAAIEAQSAQTQAALLITVDDFRTIETRLGFADSEELLLKLMEWLRRHLRPEDVVGRVSSEELALIVARPAVADIDTLCKEFCRTIEKEIFTTRHNEAHITVSIAAYPFVKGDKPDAIVNQLAQEARQLSADGGNRSILLGATAKNAEQEKIEAQKAASIKQAAEENRLRLAFQSISSLEGDPRQHLDILLRMLDPEGKEIAAAEFIDVAEKFGLMRPLDRWVCASILKLLAQRRATDEPLTCFVKLSEETLKDADGFVTWFSSVIKNRPLKQGDLVFALQEGHLQNHIRKGKALTKALRDLGADIAIEHFGKGTNSVQMLDHIPASFIKLDQDFTRDFNNPALQKVLSTLMDIAKRQQIKVIVGHVEDANLMARLWQLGVNLVQGFLIQEPTLFSGGNR